ncbi:MAG TPA: VanZ family protein [Niastella sp.]|nr:VanZ family protein [Niastella sp.]
MLSAPLFRSKWLALGWFLLVTVLFFLPGSAFPHDNWLSRVYFDKWVHAGIFAVLLFLWRSAFPLQVSNYHFLLLAGAFCYGLLVEVIQGQWVTNRSFDYYDLIADMTGAILGLLVWWWVYKKNKPL